MPQMPSQIPSLGQAPLIGQREAAAKAAIQQAIQQLSLGIYKDLATAYIATRDNHQVVDAERLRQTARDAHTAAVALFEGLGVIELQKPEEAPGDN